MHRERRQVCTAAAAVWQSLKGKRLGTPILRSEVRKIPEQTDELYYYVLPYPLGSYLD